MLHIAGQRNNMRLLLHITGKEDLSAQAVGTALYGLQSLVDSPEVRGILAVLTPWVGQ